MAMPTGKALLDPQMLFTKCGLQQGDKYADFGSGAFGHFVFPASDVVGEQGRVFAVDVIKEALEEMKQRIRHEAVHNIISVWGDVEREYGVKIPPESVDLVSLVNMAGFLKMDGNSFQEARRVLKLDGRLLIVDWRPGAGSIVVKSQNRISSENVKKVVASIGFGLIDEFDAGPQHWGLLFRKIA